MTFGFLNLREKTSVEMNSAFEMIRSGLLPVYDAFNLEGLMKDLNPVASGHSIPAVWSSHKNSPPPKMIQRVSSPMLQGAKAKLEYVLACESENRSLGEIKRLLIEYGSITFEHPAADS